MVWKIKYNYYERCIIPRSFRLVNFFFSKTFHGIIVQKKHERTATFAHSSSTFWDRRKRSQVSSPEIYVLSWTTIRACSFSSGLSTTVTWNELWRDTSDTNVIVRYRLNSILCLDVTLVLIEMYMCKEEWAIKEA